MTASEIFVASLLPAKGLPLTESMCRTACAHLENEGFDVESSAPAGKTGLDLFVRSGEGEGLRKALVSWIGDKPLDCIIQKAALRRKKLMIADMESTIIQEEMLDELAKEMGLGEKIAAITRRTMNGEIDFPTSLRERIAMMKGQPSSLLERARDRITLMPGAEELCRTMKKAGATLWLVTGGLTVFAEPVAKRLSFDAVYANRITLENGCIAGAVEEPILGPLGKKTLLETASHQLGIPLDETLTIGDGANDIPMLRTCHAAGGLALAFHAKPAVRAIIPNQLNVSDLKGVLDAQGLSLKD